MNFSNDLIAWYKLEKRTLPWRYDKDPYHVWISEIMLQQTRIEAVINYYNRFMKQLPNISSLAHIDEDELLKLWQGLGYYNRARNLKKAAIKIENEYHGVFPKNYEDIKNLPGIGEYTAGAISSICFSGKYPAVDGNVLRVITRLYMIDKNIDEPKTRKEVYQFLKENMPEDSGNFNEGLMELGERICLPNGTPLCDGCPIQKYCLAYQKKCMDKYPIKNLKKEKKKENYTILAFIYKGKIAIEKREVGLLKMMYQFPNRKGHFKKNELEKEFLKGKFIPLKPYKHIFTHIVWNIKGYIIEVDKSDDKYKWVTLEEIEEKYAIPTAFKPVLEDIRRYLNDSK